MGDSALPLASAAGGVTPTSPACQRFWLHSRRAMSVRPPSHCRPAITGDRHRPRTAVESAARGVRAMSSRGAGPGTDQGCHGRGCPPIRNHEAVPANPLAWGWVVGLERRAGSGRSGRPPSSTIQGGGDLCPAKLKSVRSGRHARRSDRRPSAAHRRDALAQQGARRRPVAGRAAGDVAGARALLGDGLRLARV